MSVVSTKSEQVIQRDLADLFAIALSSLTTVQGTDTNGYPYLTVGSVAISGGGAYISIVPEDTIQVDALGNAQRVYAPHKIRVVLEESATTDVALMTTVTFLTLMNLVLRVGTKVELWLEDNGVAPSNTTFSTADELRCTVYPDLFNALRSQM